MRDEAKPRLSAEQVLALAPDTSSQRAARSLATLARWRDAGHSPDPPSLWGLCEGSGANPYQTCVDLTEPAYRCSCPSRKFPCKHALALMLLWSADGIVTAEPPEWVTEWQTSRTDRKEQAAARAQARNESRAAKQAEPEQGPNKTAQRRADRVEAGLEELDRWLTDQVRQGIAGASRGGYAHWDRMASRLVDAQAPALASTVRRLASVAATPDRLLTELSLIRLLVAGYRRADQLPPDLAATIKARIGFPLATDAVLAGPRVRDEWAVVGVRDDGDERLMVRRFWLCGTATNRPALVLSFAGPGQQLAADLLLGTTVDADLCFYPGALPLRALVATRYAPAAPFTEPAGAVTVARALGSYAKALTAEPWLDRWPVLLADVVAVEDTPVRWHVLDRDGEALPLDPAIGPPWWLVAAAGGRPATVAAEWTPAGLRPFTAWCDGRLVRP